MHGLEECKAILSAMVDSLSKNPALEAGNKHIAHLRYFECETRKKLEHLFNKIDKSNFHALSDDVINLLQQQARKLIRSIENQEINNLFFSIFKALIGNIIATLSVFPFLGLPLLSKSFRKYIHSYFIEPSVVDINYVNEEANKIIIEIKRLLSMAY